MCFGDVKRIVSVSRPPLGARFHLGYRGNHWSIGSSNNIPDCGHPMAVRDGAGSHFLGIAGSEPPLKLEKQALDSNILCGSTEPTLNQMSALATGFQIAHNQTGQWVRAVYSDP